MDSKELNEKINEAYAKVQLDEALGYRIKPKDKKIILAFIDGATEGEGKALFIDGDELRGPMSTFISY